MINLQQTKNTTELLQNADTALKQEKRKTARELYIAAYYQTPTLEVKSQILQRCPELEIFPAFKHSWFSSHYAKTLIDDAERWLKTENPNLDGEIDWHKSYALEGLIVALLYDPSRQEEVFKLSAQAREKLPNRIMSYLEIINDRYERESKR